MRKICKGETVDDTGLTKTLWILKIGGDFKVILGDL